MKRTAHKIELTASQANPGKYEARLCEKITCEVTGEMNTGKKVWTDTKTGEQYFCMKLCGKYAFYKE